MNSILNKNIQEFALKALAEIDSELDVEYSEEQKIIFSNSEVDMKVSKLSSEASRMLALDMVFSK